MFFPFGISHTHFLLLPIELVSPTPVRLGSGRPTMGYKTISRCTALSTVARSNWMSCLGSHSVAHCSPRHAWVPLLFLAPEESLLCLTLRDPGPETGFCCELKCAIPPLLMLKSELPITSEGDYIWRWGLLSGDYVKMRSLEWVLIKSDWYP